MDSISAYFNFVKERPELFTVSDEIPLILDEDAMRKFSDETGKRMGLVYDNSPFYVVIADLCVNENGCKYSYSRVVYSNPKSSGGVAVPWCGGCFGLIRIFRHAPRCWCLEFPRGFAEDDALTPEENIRKELAEEIGVQQDDCCVTCIGSIRADSGLSSGKAQVFLAEILNLRQIKATGQEGIAGFQWVTEEKMGELIRTGAITDGFTLSALTLFHESRHNLHSVKNDFS